MNEKIELDERFPNGLNGAEASDTFDDLQDRHDVLKNKGEDVEYITSLLCHYEHCQKYKPILSDLNLLLAIEKCINRLEQKSIHRMD